MAGADDREMTAAFETIDIEDDRIARLAVGSKN